MTTATIKTIKRGEFFKLSASENAPVWVRGYYYAPEKVYECYKYDDTNRETFLKGTRKVYIDFEF